MSRNGERKIRRGEASAPRRELARARRLIEQGRHEEAAALCERAASGDGDEDALSLRAEALRKAGRHDESRAALARLVEASPRDARLLCARGEAARHCWDFAAAASDARRALSLSRDHAGAWTLLAEALRGLGRSDAAARAARSAAAAAPRESWPLVVLAKVERIRDPQRALAALDEASALRPSDHYVHGWRGEVLRRVGRADEARRSLERALKSAPGIAWIRALRGEARRDAGDAEGGAADVAEAMRVDGHFSHGYDFLGAEPAAVRADRFSAWVFAWRGAWRRGRGEKGAAADFDRARRLDPDCAWIRARRGEALLSDGRLREALGDLTAAAKALPRDADAREWAGRAWLEAGDAAKALAEFSAASKSDPRRALAFVGAAVALDRLGRGPESARAMAAARRLDPRIGTGAA